MVVTFFSLKSITSKTQNLARFLSTLCDSPPVKLTTFCCHQHICATYCTFVDTLLCWSSLWIIDVVATKGYWFLFSLCKLLNILWYLQKLDHQKETFRLDPTRKSKSNILRLRFLLEKGVTSNLWEVRRRLYQ